MRFFILSVILCMMAGCSEPTPQEKMRMQASDNGIVPEEVVNADTEGKYTIWVGSQIFAVGYDTDSYTTENGMVSFVKLSTGKLTTVPTDQVLSIDTN